MLIPQIVTLAKLTNALTMGVNPVTIVIDTVCPTIIQVKEEFPIVSLVSIKVMSLHAGRWKIRSTAPTFYGCVEKSTNFDAKDVSEMKVDESYVTFVVAGDYE